MSVLVSDLMQQDIISVQIDDSLKDVAHVFEEIKIRHIPVLSGTTLVGIISKSDVSRMKQFCQVLESGDQALLSELESMSVKKLMKQPVTIDQSKEIKEAAEILATHDFHGLPVMDNTNLVGIITSTDLIKYYMSI